MRVIRYLLISILISILLTSIVIYYLDKEDSNQVLKHVEHRLNQTEYEYNKKSIPNNLIAGHLLKGDLFQWVGQDTNTLIDTYGEPIRKDLSSYGYTWWVYTNHDNEYIQFGVKDHQIITIFATGEAIDLQPFQIGDSYERINDILSFTNETTYSEGLTSYTFQLDDEDMQMRPLVKIGNDIYLQAYFDTFTNQLSSIRILTGDVLLLQRPYALSYRGDLPEVPELSEDEWSKVESGMEKQIYDITNVIRSSFDIPKLEWEHNVREVAYLHSKDMAENNYFSHYGLNGDGLKERLADKEIFYFSAGENIAALYVDAPAAVEGWLNSKGHREALLNDSFTHLGVGVFRYYYTQNFLTKP